MKDITITQPEDLRISQIIDANLDRAREGLRVLEDWARFGLGHKDLVIRIKNFRQILGKNHLDFYKQSRNHIQDQCQGLPHIEQIKRKSNQEIICSNSARVQEALRVIEEFSRDHNYNLSEISSKIRYEIYKLEIELLNFSNRREAVEIIKKNHLYAITDQKENLLEIIEDILIGGVKIIQYRNKKSKDKDYLKEAIAIKKICKKYHALFIVNDRVDIALAVNADGIHLGKDDMDIKTARGILGNSKIIGKSANNAIDISDAIKNGCDYIGIGPVFKTSTKKDKEPLGLEKIKKLTRDIKIPWFAIGGIKKKDISNLKKNGIRKVSLVSGIINAEDPKEEAIMILKGLSHENSS